MSESLSLSPPGGGSGGGGGGGSGMFCLSRCAELFSMELLFPLEVLFVGSSSTNYRSSSTPSIDIQENCCNWDILLSKFS